MTVPGTGRRGGGEGGAGLGWGGGGWGGGHALGTGTVSGLVVLLIRLLVVDQVVGSAR